MEHELQIETTSTFKCSGSQIGLLLDLDLSAKVIFHQVWKVRMLRTWSRSLSTYGCMGDQADPSRAYSVSPPVFTKPISGLPLLDKFSFLVLTR